MIVQVEISDERLKDVLSGAFEGGCNYWAETRITKKEINKYKCRYPWEIIFNKGRIPVFDIETGEHLGILSKRTLKKGLRLMSEKYPNYLMDIINESDDAGTADVLMQLSVIGEIVYG